MFVLFQTFSFNPIYVPDSNTLYVGHTYLDVLEMSQSSMSSYQGTHGTGKMTKKNPCQGIRKFYLNTGKTQGILFGQVVNSLILKVQEFSFFPRNWICLASQFCVCNSHKLCKLAQGKFAVGQGKHREFGSTIC